MERVLVALEDVERREALVAELAALRLDPVLAGDGRTAWSVLARPDAPHLVILDDVELCRRLRQIETSIPLHVLFLVPRDPPGDGIERALEAGADDTLAQWWLAGELRARVAIGQRTLSLQRELARRSAGAERSLLPICSYCKNVRTDEDWQTVERFLEHREHVHVTHGVCPDCYDSHARPQLEAVRAGGARARRRSPAPGDLPA